MDIKWYVLYWIITVQMPSGMVDERPPVRQYYQTEAECRVEQEEKRIELEELLGKDLMTGGGPWTSIQFNGKVIGVKVGCEPYE